MNRLSLISIALLPAFLLATPTKAEPPISTEELVTWCSVVNGEDASRDALIDEISCLAFLGGAMAGIESAAIRVSDEHWSAGFDGAVELPQFYCVGNATAGEIRDAMLPHLKKAPQESPGRAVLWSLERAFPCAYNDFWRPF